MLSSAPTRLLVSLGGTLGPLFWLILETAPRVHYG
jgi:hypothetical protein